MRFLLSGKNKYISQRGSILVYEVVLIFIFSMVILSVLAYATAQFRVIRSTVAREQALQIAEAGVNYYQWRLAHFPSDFQDGTGANGPYVHDFVDKNTNQIIGKFSIDIIPPTVGSTVATIQSTGWTLDNPNTKRVVTTKYGIPSLAKYAFISNSDMWIGDTESVQGLLHTNGGIRFDGTANAPVNSARSTYTCQTYHGCSPATLKPGIWGTAPQSTQSFWKYPVPAQDFSGITGNLATIKTNAQASGIYLPPSNAQGYSLVFNSNGTVDVYKITSLRSHPVPGYDVNIVPHNEYTDYSARSLQFNQLLPSNGVIFVEDKVWVEGVVPGRVLVAAAKLPYNVNTAPSIYIPNNITYPAKDGNSSLGLIAQKDIIISYYAPNVLEIDAAIFAQNGSTQFFYYNGNIKNTITVYGAVGSYGVWTWSWVNGAGSTVSGYATTNTVYDSNLLYSPPPNFPLSTDGYQQLYWQSDQPVPVTYGSAGAGSNCPGNSFSLQKNTLQVNDVSNIFTPQNYSGGFFAVASGSPDAGVARIEGQNVRGLKAGSAVLSGVNWTYTGSPSAVGCALTGPTLTVTNPPPACPNATFSLQKTSIKVNNLTNIFSPQNYGGGYYVIASGNPNTNVAGIEGSNARGLSPGTAQIEGRNWTYTGSPQAVGCTLTGPTLTVTN